MPRSKKSPKGKPLNEDRIAKVKPSKPWPDPPKSSSKPNVKPTSTSKPAKKD